MTGSMRCRSTVARVGSGSASRCQKYEQTVSATVTNTTTTRDRANAFSTAGRKHQPALAIIATPSTTLCDSERIRCVRFSRAICRPKEIDDQHDQQAADAGDPASSMEKLLPPSAGGENHSSQHHVVAQITDSRPAMTAITCPAVPSRNGLNTTSSAIIASEPMMVNGTTAGLAASPYIDAGNERERHQYHVRDDLNRQYFAKSDLRRGFLGNGLLSGHLGPPFYIVVNPYAI